MAPTTCTLHPPQDIRHLHLRSGQGYEGSWSWEYLETGARPGEESSMEELGGKSRWEEKPKHGGRSREGPVRDGRCSSRNWWEKIQKETLSVMTGCLCWTWDDFLSRCVRCLDLIDCFFIFNWSLSLLFTDDLLSPSPNRFLFTPLLSLLSTAGLPLLNWKVSPSNFFVFSIMVSCLSSCSLCTAPPSPWPCPRGQCCYSQTFCTSSWLLISVDDKCHL